MRLRLMTSLAISCALLAAPVAASHPTTSEEVARVAATLDSAELRAFVESRPTPDEFHQAFPDVWLILPGDIVSRDTCSQYHRFIAELDPNGRISGGSLE